MSEQDESQAGVRQRPATNDREEWKAYWQAQGQSWRTEVEIDAERQALLAERRSIRPDIEQGNYPFEDIKLSRADVEWLLATHENGRGPVDWNDESQRERKGLDLRGADLSMLNLSFLPLTRLCAGLTHNERWLVNRELRHKAAAHLKGTNFFQVHLEAAILGRARLEDANLELAHLELADLGGAHLEGASLRGAYLEGTYLKRAFFNAASNLNYAKLSSNKIDAPLVTDVDWNSVNLAVIDWSQIDMLGDERKAQELKKFDGETKDKNQSIDAYEEAVRANRQLAIALSAQGLNEVAARFAYRAQVLQRKVFWFQMSVQQVKFRQRMQSLGRWLFSWFLHIGAGYGYKPFRCFVIYLLALIGFTLAHYIVGAIDGHSLTFLNALAVSIQSLHGRLFSFQTSDPQIWLNTIEAFVGLFIEAIVVAVITQRILGK